MRTSAFTKMKLSKQRRRKLFNLALTSSIFFLFTLFGNAQSFSYTGAQQTYVVPAGINKMEIIAYGAEGGSGQFNTLGGKGGYAKGFLDVTPGQTLYLYIGGKGESVTSTTLSGGGYNGGGNSRSTTQNPVGAGGGATDVRVGGTTLAHRVIVAGGGGGTCGGSSLGGDGGGHYG